MTGRDVVVVGARVAGAATAMLLARAGLRVTVLDRAAYGSDTLSTHALMRAGVMQLSRWGLLDAVIASGAPAVRRTTFHYADEESVEVVIRPGGGVDALYAPRRHVLDRLLVDAAVAAGAEVRHGATVTGLLRGRDGAVEGVVTRGPDGRRREELRAALTIGADGIRSVVAAEVAAPTLRHGAHVGATLYRYVEGVAATGYEWAYGDRAMAGLIPTHDGACVLFVSGAPARVQALRRTVGVDGTFAALLDAAGPRLVERVAAARVVSRTYGWSGVPGHVRRSHGPGWALVGDAGYFKDPATAHGITDALRDAELLARAVVVARDSAAARAAALRGYQQTRDRLSRALFEATEQVASFRWDLDEVRRLLRLVNAGMSDEVDHLAALPAPPPAPTGWGIRPGGPGLAGIIPADTGAGTSVA